uniref:Epsin 3 n=1 Tax=Xenopus tropicalis TaxID=8364 RepID=A0A803KCU5_XENTR
MATSSIRRQVKNIVHNYSEAEVKVREATSNDPWGPSTSLMSEISLMTHHAEAFPEVMIMIWKRLNDSGKNWRHVYKALTLLDYLIKNGSKKVVEECNENIHSVQTLKDFQFLDRDGKDQGINVREKAKQIVSLLKDEERLKQERIQAKNTRRRISQGVNAISTRKISFSQAASGTCSDLSPDLEQARPQSSGEEELQLQLALAMSREEAEKKVPSAPDEEEEQQIQAALNQSKEEYEKQIRLAQGEKSLLEKALNQFQPSSEYHELEAVRKPEKSETHLLDLVDVFGPAPSASTDPWNSVSLLTPNNGPTRSASFGSLYPTWATTANGASATGSSSLPWDTPSLSTQLREDQTSQSIIFGSESSAGLKKPTIVVKSPASDPWGDSLPSPDGNTFKSSSMPESPFELDLFGEVVSTTKSNPDSLDLKALEDSLDDDKANTRCRTPESFLDPAARSLVNLDSLIPGAGFSAKNRNPFASGRNAPAPNNLSQLGEQKLSLNQMRTTSPEPGAAAPLIPVQNVSTMPAISMGPIPNTLPAFSTGPGFVMPTSNQLLMPLYGHPAALGIPPSLSVPLHQVPALHQVPITLPPPIQPQFSQGGNNPFL